MPGMAQRVSQFGTTIFTEINVLAREQGAVNLRRQRTGAHRSMDWRRTARG